MSSSSSSSYASSEESRYDRIRSFLSRYSKLIMIVSGVSLLTILIIIIGVLAPGWVAIDYCPSTACKQKGSHTMCLYSSSYPSAQCGKYISDPLTSADIDAIVKKHNEWRKKVADGLETRGNPGPQPPAKNMQSLKWDKELAQIAQRYADQCVDGHDGCRNVDRFSVGQNIATTSSTGDLSKVKVASLMEGWYDEVALFDKNNVASFHYDKAIGHYSQVVWAKTSLVGCGKVHFRVGGMTNVRLICNYGPSGNYAQEPVYMIAS